MNSGAPASTAPPDFSSLGMMASHRNVTDAYCEAEKYLGAYFPAGAVAFSLCTIWWMYSAASAGMTCRTEPVTPTARVRKMSRREMDSLAILNIALSGFVEEIFGGTPRESHDGERGIFVGIGDERSAIGDEKIFDVMRLAKAAEDGSFGIGAHARGADFVDDFSSRLDAKGIFAVDGSFGFVFAAHGFDDRAESFLHVLGLQQFVIGPFEMEAQDGNAPLIEDIGIDFAISVGVGN